MFISDILALISWNHMPEIKEENMLLSICRFTNTGPRNLGILINIQKLYIYHNSQHLHPFLKYNIFYK